MSNLSDGFMETDQPLPDSVVEFFKQHTNDEVTVVGTPSDHSIDLRSSYEYPIGAEFTRHVGILCIQQTGYAITGLREHENYVTIWLDPVPEQKTIAERAAEILDVKECGTEFEPSDSIDPKEQYVDVYPEPHEQASEDFGLRERDFENLREAGLRIRTMSCGLKRGRYNDANYRIWFETLK